MPKTKVAVVVPSGDMVHSRFMVCLTSLFQHSERSGLDLVIINPRSSLIGTGRQMGVDEALRRNVDYVLFLDSDMTFPHAALTRLISLGKDIVGATYVRRYLPTSFVHEELPPTEGRHQLDANTLGCGVREVLRLPAGVLLIKSPVFEDLEAPYFRCSYENGTERGEDYYFCDTAREAGYPVWLDADLSKLVGHLGIYTHTHHDLA